MSEPSRRLSARMSGLSTVTLELVTSKRIHAKERQYGWLGLARPRRVGQ